MIATAELDEFAAAFWAPDVTDRQRAPLRAKRARACALGGEKQGVFDAIGYEPAFEAQEAFHLSGSRYRLLRFGRRSGKTLACVVELVCAALLDDVVAWIVAPTHDTTRRVWGLLCRVLCGTSRHRKTGLYGLGIQSVSRSDQSPRYLELPWGARIEGKSTQPGSQDSLVGEGLDALVWDECARSPGSVWDEELAPSLIDRRGWAVFASTPQGFNHFHEKWRYTQAGDKVWQPGWESFYAPSSANPYLSAEDIEAEGRRMTPETFAQEYEAAFTQLAGRVYAEWDEGVHVKPLVFDASLPLSLAFDFGTTDASPFVCLWIQETPENEVRVLHELVIPNRSTYECAHLVEREHNDRRERWPQCPAQAKYAVGDVAARDGRITLEQHCPVLSRGGVDYHTSEIEAGIEALRQLLRPLGVGGPVRLFVDPSCEVMRFEFNLYQRREHRERTDVKPAPIKERDHCLDALRYYVMGRSTVSIARNALPEEVGAIPIRRDGKNGGPETSFQRKKREARQAGMKAHGVTV